MMRKIILYIASSLDNFIAEKNHGLDFLFHDKDYGYSDFIKEIDVILMGKKTYDVCFGFEKWPYEGKKCYVFSREKHINTQHAEFISNPVEFTSALLRKPGKNIWLMGGGKIASEFFNHHLVDEIILAVHPVILGEGVPLFSHVSGKITLKLTDTRPYDTGLVQLTYAIQK